MPGLRSSAGDRVARSRAHGPPAMAPTPWPVAAAAPPQATGRRQRKGGCRDSPMRAWASKTARRSATLRPFAESGVFQIERALDLPAGGVADRAVVVKPVQFRAFHVEEILA